MSFSLSPEVKINEIDLTTSIPAVATSIGAIVGNYVWGPVDEATLINREDNLVSTFGLPNDTNFGDWFCAANFLSYAANLQTVRVVSAAARNASNNAAVAAIIKNQSDFDTKNAAGTIDGWVSAVVAKYPGVYGNDIVVHSADSTSFTGWAHETLFDTAPTGTEIALVVLKAGAIVEQFFADTSSTAKDYQGNSLFVDDVVARTSGYIWTNAPTFTGSATGAPMIYTLTGGVDSVTPTAGDYEAGWTLAFSNPDTIDINLCMAGNAGPAVGGWIVQNIALTRLDCVGFTSPGINDVVGQATPESTITALRGIGGALNISSSYGFMDGNFKYQYDRYNDKYRWVPLNGDVAGLCAHTDYIADPWYSPAGFNRGFIKNVTKLAFNPNKAQRDMLYKNNINPVVTFKGQGTVLFGDKTMQTKPSAFDRIGVRRLFIVLEKAIANASKYTLFEFNDSFTRARFRQMVEPFLRDVKGRRGIYDFAVICDTSNNTPTVIDRNEFIGDIYIKPARSINSITLNMIAVKTGVVFKEVIG